MPEARSAFASPFDQSVRFLLGGFTILTQNDGVVTMWVLWFERSWVVYARALIGSFGKSTNP